MAQNNGPKIAGKRQIEFDFSERFDDIQFAEDDKNVKKILVALSNLGASTLMVISIMNVVGSLPRVKGYEKEPKKR